MSPLLRQLHLLQRPDERLGCLMIHESDCQESTLEVLVYSADEEEWPAEAVGLEGGVHKKDLSIATSLSSIMSADM